MPIVLGQRKWLIAGLVTLALVCGWMSHIVWRGSPLWVEGAARTVAFSPNGQAVAATVGDTVNVWRLSDRKLLMAASGYWGALTWSPDGSMLASADGWSCSVTVWNAIDGAIVTTFAVDLQVDYYTNSDLAWSPDGKLLASSCTDERVLLWRLGLGEPVQTLENAGGMPQWSADGQRLATVGGNTVSVWHLQSDGSFKLSDHLPRLGQNVILSPDWQLMAAASRESVELWNVREARRLCSLVGPADLINTIVFSPDGRNIATTAGVFFESGESPRDTTVRLWRVEDCSLVRIYRGHLGAFPRSVSFSPNGQLLASAAGDTTIRFWRIPGGE